MQIAVPRTEEVQGKTVFIVEVDNGGMCFVVSPSLPSLCLKGNKWTLQKRYSEFHDFRATMNAPVVGSLPFPEKQVTRSCVANIIVN
jgi:hypothetical protein